MAHPEQQFQNQLYHWNWTRSDTSITPQKRGAIDLNVDEVIDCIVSNRWRSAVKGRKNNGGCCTYFQLVHFERVVPDTLVYVNV